MWPIPDERDLWLAADLEDDAAIRSFLASTPGVVKSTAAVILKRPNLRRPLKQINSASTPVLLRDRIAAFFASYSNSPDH
jgi:hypothetical protein